jgi:glucose/arabinose dehydrogenase
MYIAEKGGVIKVVRDGGAVQTVIDISDRVNEFQDRGLIDFAIHPDFENNPYIYLLYTVDPPEVYDNEGHQFAGPDARGNRAGRLIRVTADASTNYTSVVANSEVILLGSNSTWQNFNGFTDSTLDFTEPAAGLNPDGSYLNDFINSDSRSHTVGSLAFGLDGSLFVSIGDGASFNRTDVRALRVQDLDSLSGKVLRIDALTGQGLSDNPFFNGDANANRSKVYHYGLRNPWRLSVDPDSGQLFIGDTGLSNFEEINTGAPGTNFGWPFYEGGQGVNRATPSYVNLAASQAFYNSGQFAKPATIALAHGAGSDTVVLGAVAQDLNLGPQYDGDVFYNDMARGVVRHADVDENGNLLGIQVFTTGAQFVVDIQQGVDGSLYYVNLVEGTVGRWEIV